MQESIETIAGAIKAPYRIEKRYGGRLHNAITERELEWYAQVMGSDIAVEFRPPKLELFFLAVEGLP